MRVRVRFLDRHEYVASAIPFLERVDPVRCTVSLTVADSIARGMIETCTLSVIEGVDANANANANASAGASALIGTASWTPPHMLLLSPMFLKAAASIDLHEAARAIAEAWAGRFGGSEIAGVVGPRDIAVPCAARLGELTHRTATERMAERLFRLDAVTDPPFPSSGGAFRLARVEDVELLASWFDRFVDEANVTRGDNTERDIRNRIAQARLYVWEANVNVNVNVNASTSIASDDASVPVSLVGHTVSIAGITRIGPVYTPPVHRGRGFARALVAAVSRARLAAGDTACCLFTDLANPVSNAIYQQVGYRPVADYAQIDLRSPS